MNKKTMTILIIAMTAAATVVIWGVMVMALKGKGSSYRTVMSVESSTKDRFSMKYQKFSGTKKYTANLNKGDILRVNIETEDGSLDLAIVEKGNEEHYLYTGKDIPTSKFTVTCDADGTYLVKLTGDKHKGSYEVSIKDAGEHD